MSFPEIRDCEPRINDKDLDKVESRLGIILPNELRQHLLKHNGGTPDPDFFESSDGMLYQIRGFLPVKYGIIDDPELTLEAFYETLVGKIPPGWIPFADDQGGNLFCYGIAKENMHSISFWEHEFHDDASQGISKLAPSLHDFLSGFIPDPDDEDDDED